MALSLADKFMKTSSYGINKRGEGKLRITGARENGLKASDSAAVCLARSPSQTAADRCRFGSLAALCLVGRSGGLWLFFDRNDSFWYIRHRAGGGWGRAVEMMSAFDRELVAVESGDGDVWIAWRR